MLQKRQEINTDNWNCSRYYSGDNRSSIISKQFTPENYKNTIAIKETYLVSVTELTYGRDLWQLEFNFLEEAIHHTNTHYGHWKLIESREKTTEGGGCGSCSNNEAK